ncbi:MAG: hypothetical protein QOF43_1, partial [Gaiellaceae bacterium]|nr:hypothetical protein [Gaiellaceae bacterium]
TGGIGGVLGSTSEGSSISLSGTADHGDTTWAATGGTGTCTFTNATSPVTAVTCTDDGDYRITLTANDHVNPPQSANGTLHVSNVAPHAALTLSPGPHPLAQPVNASIAISDPGADTFTCVIDWGDGAPTPGVVSGNACAGSHTYTAGGLHSVSATVTDDNGGSGSDSQPVTIDTPPTAHARPATGNEGSPVPLVVDTTDDGSITVNWSISGGTGTCAIANEHAASTTATCNDDGPYTAQVTVSDGVNPAASDTATLQVSNVAPGLSLTSSASGLTVTVTGTVTDAGAHDTQTCSFAWGDGTTTAGVPVSGATCVASNTYAGGTHSATVSVTATDDDNGATTRSITQALNRPPACTGVSPSVAELWPPNHTLQLIVLRGATDADGDALAYAITSVRQDEPTNGTGDGDTAIDAVNAGPGAVRLRAERTGGGDGRVYTIAFTVSDGKGGSCAGTVQVTVPKSASKAAVLTPGPGYDSYH